MVRDRRTPANEPGLSPCKARCRRDRREAPLSRKAGRWCDQGPGQSLAGRRGTWGSWGGKGLSSRRASSRRTSQSKSQRSERREGKSPQWHCQDGMECRGRGRNTGLTSRPTSLLPTSAYEATQTCTHVWPRGKLAAGSPALPHPDPAVCLQPCPKPDAFDGDARSCLNKRLCNPSRAEEMSFPIPSH